MKKKIFTLLAIMMLVSSISISVYAGDINSAEQRIIAAISATYEYEGAYYRVTDAYIEKVKEYLNRDNVDMSEREVEDYLNQFYANIPLGISSGYMECVGVVEEEEETKKPDKTEKPEESKESEQSNKDEQYDDDDDSVSNSNGNTDNENENNSETEVLISETVTESETVIEDVIKVNADGTIEVSGDDTEMSTVIETTGVVTTTVDESSEVFFSTEEMTETMTDEVMPETKDYSDAEPYQQGISVGTIAIAVVIVVAIAMVCVLLWHRNKRYRR